MAISLTKVHPLTANPNISIGVAFPLDEINIFKGTRTVRDQLKSNFLNLLLTEPGERVNEPNFGIGLKKLLFEPDINEDVLSETINNQTQRFIPQITLMRVNTQFNPNEHLLSIKIDYKFNLDNTIDSIQLNFLE